MAFETASLDALVRTLHIAAGVVWIGHLYFFNLTNLPVFAFKIQGGDPAVKGGPALMLRALWWFRWGAMFTLLFGLWLLDIIARQHYEGYSQFFGAPEGKTIALGMGLGIIMWFNVWFIIWPNQKVVLNNNIKIAGGVAPEEKAKMEADNAPRMKNAKMASRINFWLSIPLLVFMVFAAHAPFDL